MIRIAQIFRILIFRTTQEVNKLVSQLPPSIAALTGVDISTVISGLSSDGVKV